MMQVRPGPWDSPAVIMRSADMGAQDYGRRDPRARLSAVGRRGDGEAPAPVREAGRENALMVAFRGHPRYSKSRRRLSVQTPVGVPSGAHRAELSDGEA